MPIITSYPFKNAPIDSDEEIIISDSKSNDPRFKTKTTNLKAIGSFSSDDFDFTQGVPSATWVIEHNLNKFPSVTVVNESKEVMIGCLLYTSDAADEP